MTAIDAPGSRMNALQELPLDVIMPNPDQPRRHFDKAALEELAESIKAVGVLEPIVVNVLATCATCTMPEGDRHHSPDYQMHRVPWDIPRHPYVTRYQIIAGERRYRAAQLAGLDTMPAIIRDGIGADEAFVLSLVENCIREDMNPPEAAEEIALLAEEVQRRTVRLVREANGRRIAVVALQLTTEAVA